MHPSIKILNLLLLAATVHLMLREALLLLAGLLVLLLIWHRARVVLKMLMRMRWLYLSLIIIYAFNTPGEYIHNWPFEFAPTYEGINAGLMQIARISIMLAGLALLLITSTRENLMTGFYILMSPLRFFRLSPERFAARLWLTLHYVDNPIATASNQSLFERISDVRIDDKTPFVGPESITLDLPKITWRDGLALLVMAMLGVVLL